MASAARLDCAIGDLDLNGNTFTIVGPQRIIDGRINTGVNWQVSTIAGKGNYVLNGAGTHLLKTCPDFTGTLTVNNGWFVAETTGLPKVSEYVIAGAFTNHKKYPRAGRVQIGSHFPAVSKLPDRLNHDGALVFKGGYLEYAGQGLDETLRGKAVLEQVKQIRFVSGMSEIRMVNGNDVSGSTTLLANDPANGLVRRQGATLMIGGDDGRSAGLFTGDGRGREAHLCQRHVPFPQGRRGPAGLQEHQHHPLDDPRHLLSPRPGPNGDL